MCTKAKKKILKYSEYCHCKRGHHIFLYEMNSAIMLLIPNCSLPAEFSHGNIRSRGQWGHHGRMNYKDTEP